jgi:hypothetical protein
MRMFIGAVVLVAACANDDTDQLPPLTDARELRCPRPGDLPFRLRAPAFAIQANADATAAKPRIKDESSDTIGNPGGPLASTYLLDDQPVAAAPGTYRGTKSRTGVDEGLFGVPIAGEAVSLWTFDDAVDTWSEVARAVTDPSGGYELTVAGPVAEPGRPVYSMLEGDGTCAAHYDFVLPAGAKVVVTDVDGTLTADDGELLRELTDGAYVGAMKAAANRLLQTWAAKGYPVIYLTARPHLFRAETRAWLTALTFPIGPTITAEAIGDASAYKTIWLERMIEDFGWNVVAAYGNASTDISAYANAGIAKDTTFIIGPLAGADGTVPIADDDYSEHIRSYVETQPDNEP